MKQDINLGAYGWRQAHWMGSFYPEDLPVDWQLTYYSNEFNAVLVPAYYWQEAEVPDGEDWLDSVHEGFRFFVECHVDMFDHISSAELETQLKHLQPQLSGLVFLDEKQSVSASRANEIARLASSLAVAVFGSKNLIDLPGPGQVENIWRAGRTQAATLAYIENDLTDLRSVRTLIDDFAGLIKNTDLQQADASIIVQHPQLQAGDLAKLRSVIEIMGY